VLPLLSLLTVLQLLLTTSPLTLLLLLLLLLLCYLLQQQQLSLTLLLLLLLALLLLLLHFRPLLFPLLLQLLRSLLQPQLQNINRLTPSSHTAQQAVPRIAAAPMLLTHSQQRQRTKVATLWPLQPSLLQACCNLAHQLPCS
jgi:hypothetical protein